MKDIVKYVLNLPSDTLSFHSIVIKKDEVSYDKYHSGDKELAFFKFIYVLLKQKLTSYKNYYIFPDQRPTSQERLNKLKDYLDKYIYFNLNETEISKLQSYSSRENLFIQLADIFAGSVAYHYTNFSESNPREDESAKNELALYIAELLGQKNLSFQSEKIEKKFNIFRIKLNNFH